LAREILVAARQGGGDPAANIGLRALVQKARSINMPADNVDRAIRKGTGELESEALEELQYEGYAPGGVALLVAVLTDNRNRSASEVRSTFTKHGGKLAGQGQVAHLFRRRGQIFVDASAVDEDRLMELALDLGVEDLQHDGDQYEILTDPAGFAGVLDRLEQEGIPVPQAELTLLADTEVPVSDETRARSLVRFVDALEELDDVQAVHANFSIDDSIVEAIGSDEE
jgi:YebC/PmpR family DNA-binding regulatory protein